jgi:hypothetical protein
MLIPASSPPEAGNRRTRAAARSLTSRPPRQAYAGSATTEAIDAAVPPDVRRPAPEPAVKYPTRTAVASGASRSACTAASCPGTKS